MKHLTTTLITLSLVALLLGACSAVPAPTASPVAGSVAPAGEWQTYTNAEVGFSIKMPPTWSQQALPDQNGGAIHGMAFTGPEGGVEVYWGVGFGGACPTGTVPVQLAQGELPACHVTNSDGTETWSQIGYQVSGGNSFSVRAYTSDAQPASHDLVLQVLATLTFMLPAQPQTGAATPPLPAGASVANPASQNCVNQGGTLSIETRGDGGQFGVCYFEDNRQCEEWALLRGDCPVGGVKVTGYTTPAARYCAITGGTHTVTGKSGAEDEQGTCTLKDGSQCDAWDYYNGKCQAGAAQAPAPAPTATAGATIQPLTMEVCDGQAQAMAHALDVLEVTQSEAPLSNPVTGASGTGCEAMVTGTGEQFKSPDAVVKTLDSMLEDQGWTQDPMLAAGGPNAIDLGYRKGDQICWAGAGWRPDASANCPKDQPVSDCQVTPQQQMYTITLNCGVEVSQGGAAGTAVPSAAAPTTAVITATQVMTYTPGPPTGAPQEGNCWTNSLAVWRADAWRCAVGNGIYDPCFSQDDSLICGANPTTTTVSFLLTLTEPLPTPAPPPDTGNHAWLVGLADGMVCEYATGATGGVGGERFNYLCPSPNPGQYVVILGDLQPGVVWMAKRAVVTGGMPNLTILESAMVPVRTLWR
jgi:putative hemolysin